MYNTFKLPEDFVASYASQKPKFGFNGLGELTYFRTYSRLKPNGVNEQFYEMVERVVNCIYSIQKNWIQQLNLSWNEKKAIKSAKIMYDKIFTFKMAAGRGFWALSPELLEKKGGMALHSCAFVSTDNIETELSAPFEFLMDVSMLGVGCGFDLKGAGTVKIKNFWQQGIYEIPDTREGWVESLKIILQSYFTGVNLPNFSYEKIRKFGEPIKTFGGTSSGSAPLKELHENIHKILTPLIGNTITELAILDIMNMIGVCVVSGNVRRTAEIAFGDSEQFTEYKDFVKYPKRNDGKEGWSWTSNNTIFATPGQSYKKAAETTAIIGDPGYFWLETARKYGRLVDPPNYKDSKAKGGNPCLEQTLHSNETCNLVETFPANCTDLSDYKETLKYAYLFAKTVTLIPTHNKKTNEVNLCNRRIGLSMAGIVQLIGKIGMFEYVNWCEEGYKTVQYYDKVYSDWFKIPISIKTTCVKPSGTVSLLAGATPGIHFPEAPFYIRRINIAKNSKLIPIVIKAGYKYEESIYDRTNYVIEVPVKAENVQTLNDVNAWQQIKLAATAQKYWADNQVSCTVTLKPHEFNKIETLLNYFERDLKGISFLPKIECGAYPQMPYEEIDEFTYLERIKSLMPLDCSSLGEESTPEKYCTNDYCEL